MSGESPKKTKSDSTLDELRALSKLIDESVKSIERSMADTSAVFPALNEPFTLESEMARLNPPVMLAASHIIAAAAQLTAIVRPAGLSLAVTAFQFHLPSALRVAIETNVVEILREAGPQGLDVNEICKKNNADPNKLSRILRLLATEFIFREVSPDVFANNRISSILDTGKSSAELLANPSNKHVDSSGIAALVCHFTNHAFKTSSYLTETFLDESFAKSHEPTKTAFNKAYNTDVQIFPWFELPGNEKELSLFASAMDGGKNMSPPDVILNGFDWKSLPKDSVVVDVGGGVGSQSLVVAKANPHLKVVVQDREPVMADAMKFWQHNLPEALETKQVVLQSNDFFTGQPVKNAAVYFMRMILHDWSNDYCVEILKHLRDAAAPETNLLIIDAVMSYACIDNTHSINVPSATGELPPAPLLPNNGHANIAGYLGDVQVMAFLNGQERTLPQLNNILEASGWKLAKVFRAPYFAAAHQQVLAVPA